MKLLGLDSSGLVASVAVVADDDLLGEYTVNYKKTHSQTLLPMIDEMVKMTETDLNTIDAIAVAGGPGSFTGLRIGAATAKGLGVEEHVNSPTFTIVQEYEDGRMPFYHFDVYRIGDIEEMDEIGFEEYVAGEGVCLIEWANLIEEILPEERTEILIEKDLEQGFDFRRITVTERK